MLNLLITGALGATASAPLDEISLMRTFRAGSKDEYEVKSHLQIEQRQFGLNTWIPEDLDVEYKYTVEVKELKVDDIAKVLYTRPTMTVIEGETFDTPAKTKVEKVDYKYELDLSPTNEILNIKDLNPKKPEEKKDGFWLRSALAGKELAQQSLLDAIGGDLYRMALFISDFEGSLDFSPKLPYEEIEKGYKWKRTVSYQPQRLRGDDNKVAMQRVDYTYEYDGVVESQGKQVHRVKGYVNLDTDYAEYIHQMMGRTSQQTGLKEVRLKIDTLIEFDLDLQTRKTLRTVATANGTMNVVITRLPNEPVLESRFKGRTIMRLLSSK